MTPIRLITCIFFIISNVVIIPSLYAETEVSKNTALSGTVMRRLSECFFQEAIDGHQTFQHFDESNAVVLIDGKRHLGFSLQIPGKADGPITILMAAANEEAHRGVWRLASSDGQIIETLSAQSMELKRPSFLAERYPNRKDIKSFKISLQVTEPFLRFYLIQELQGSDPASIDILLGIDSAEGRQKFGEIHAGQSDQVAQLSAKEAMSKAKEIKQKQGNQAAITFLTRELESHVDDEGMFQQLYSVCYREASGKDGGSGRMDKDWAADLDYMIFKVCTKHRYYFHQIEVSNNALISLDSAGQYGRKAEVIEIYTEAMKLGGYRLDLTACADRGPAFKQLPEVRLRDFPAMLPYALSTFPEGPPRSKPFEFYPKFHLSTLQYAYTLKSQGHWKSALEWMLWIRDWTGKGPDGFPIQMTGNVSHWHASVTAIAGALSDIGFDEEALVIYDKAMLAPYDRSYNGRSQIFLKIDRYALMISLGTNVSDLIPSLEDLVTQAKNHPSVGLRSHQYAEQILALGLIHVGKEKEGLVILDRLVAEGYFSARASRLKYWVRHGISEGVEAEFFTVLRNYRESGNKSGETWLYILYADFLEQQGRDDVALHIRREAIRLCRSFDYFTYLPIELAKLARLLERVGDTDGRTTAEAEARKLMAQDRLPLKMASELQKLLDSLRAIPAAEKKKDFTLFVDVQPQHSIVIPLKGKAWTTYATVSNPSDRAVNGILNISGLPSELLFENGRLVAKLGIKGGKEVSSLPLRLEAGIYQLVEIEGLPLVSKDTQVKLEWQAAGNTGNGESLLDIKASTDKITSTVIQAGEYRINPFCGVPVYHQYLTHGKDADSIPLRFITSQTARVEVYDLNGVPLCVDAQGNGSLRDRGDELFKATDQHGNLRLQLKDGVATFMLLVYADADLPKEGLILNVEGQENGIWEVYSQDLIKP